MRTRTMESKANWVVSSILCRVVVSSPASVGNSATLPAPPPATPLCPPTLPAHAAHTTTPPHGPSTLGPAVQASPCRAVAHPRPAGLQLAFSLGAKVWRGTQRGLEWRTAGLSSPAPRPRLRRPTAAPRPRSDLPRSESHPHRFSHRRAWADAHPLRLSPLRLRVPSVLSVVSLQHSTRLGTYGCMAAW